jgi:pilus assembly protein CpaE
MAACLERLLVTLDDLSPDRRSGEVVAFLKAGGGVGATALATQCAALLARRDAGQVCIADFDLQFGAAGLYLDLPDAMTIDDVLASGPGFGESAFASTLAHHRSGARVLAAPRDITPLEYLSASQADTLVQGLKREFALTLLELPTVWTAWTNRLLQLADRLVMVTNLSVPHMHLVKRQQRLIAAQGLETQPLLLVCNALAPEQVSQVSLKAAERALGRKFDVVIPEDRKVMNAAINEGQMISSVRRGTKLEKAIIELADRVAAGVTVQEAARG